MATAFRQYVRRKAINSDSTIIYLENGQIIEEDPKNLTKTIFKVDLPKNS